MIQLSSPNTVGNEKKYIDECLESGWISTSGPFIDRFEEALSEYTNSKYVVGCINGTSALHISLRLLDVKAGDEVIVPTITFISTINSIAYNNASPIFMDCDDFYNIDAEKTIEFINNETYFKSGHTYNKKTNKRIPVIVPVHVWGNALWLDDLFDLCKKRNIKILEDASESLGTKYIKGKFNSLHPGTIGEIGCLSFNANKIVTSGGGGAILTSDKTIADRARYLISQAKDDPIKYIHNEVGYNYRITNINAAIGLAQLEKINDILEKKRAIRSIYSDKISEIKNIDLAATPSYAANNFWLNLISLSDNHKYSVWELFNKFEDNKIQTRPVWQLNHLQNKYKNCQSFKIVNAEKKLRNSLCIPSSNHLTKNQIEEVINILREIV